MLTWMEVGYCRGIPRVEIINTVPIPAYTIPLRVWVVPYPHQIRVFGVTRTFLFSTHGNIDVMHTAHHGYTKCILVVRARQYL
jgi:hypothetical protein